jgi:hypothetical protein
MDREELSAIFQILYANRAWLEQIEHDTATVRVILEFPQTMLHLERFDSFPSGDNVSAVIGTHFSFEDMIAGMTVSHRILSSNSATKTAHDEKQDGSSNVDNAQSLCEHKSDLDCVLNSPKCCTCLDARPCQGMTSYQIYIDGQGWVRKGRRWKHYCSQCQRKIFSIHV